MVTFYELSDAGIPTKPVLYLDTLKVSTIEQTGEEAESRGGKGNPPIIIWDYNKEITVTLEDALFSAKSLAIMFGNGSTQNFDSSDITGSGSASDALIMRTMEFTCVESSKFPYKASFSGTTAPYWADNQGKQHQMLNPVYFDENGSKLATGEAALVAGKKYFVTYDVAGVGSVIDISANSFPGTYYVTGDTYARSNVSGKDEMFQFIIPKAKVKSENTITLEAEGDPSVFNMSLRVLRPSDGVMMKLVKYNPTAGQDGAATGLDLVHNHDLASAAG